MTKKRLKEICKEIIEISADFLPLEGEDAIFMNKILRLHPEAQEKIGCGVKYIYVANSKNFKTRCFHVKRIDETVIDFSYPSCIDQKKSSPLEDFKKACRHAIREDITKFKFSHPQASEDHIVHHEGISFNVIVNDLLEKKLFDINKIEYTKGTTTEFINIKFKENFRKFHNKRAKLKLMTKEEHKKIHSTDSLKPDTCTCGYGGEELSEKVLKNKVGAPMIQGNCPQCDKWMKWVAYDKSSEVKRILIAYCDKQKEN